MKKITFLLTVFVSLFSQAQVISENFDTALNWTTARISGTSTAAGWSRVTAGTNPSCTPYQGAGMAKFDSYNIAAGNVFALTSPSFNLVGTSAYKVKFYMYRDNAYPTDADKVDVHITTTATTAPSTTNKIGTVHRTMQLTPVVSEEGWYEYSFNIPAGTSGARYIRLVGTSAYGNTVYLDKVSVETLLTNDLGMDSVTVASTLMNNATTSITGTFKNNGSNVVNTATLNWQVDAGTVYSQNLTGLNLASGATYTFTHTNQWTPTTGNYSLKVWVSNPNGSADNYLTDNEKIRAIRVASNTTARKSLLEKFTSSTCGPCAGYNSTAFSPFYTSNSNNLCLINYQVNWPGSGDPYYTAETGTRRTYYQVSAAPTLFMNAKTSGSGTSAELTTELNAANATTSYMAVSATKNLVGSVMNINVTTTPYLTGAFRLYAVIVEKTTTGNVATNGETSFKNVMMKMVPDANGTVINCVADTPLNTSLSVDLASGTFIEDINDLEVIVFVQEYATKEIMNAGYATQQLASESFILNKIKIYPNPSNGVINLDTNIPTDVTVFDITGKEVYNAKAITSEKAINLNVQPGVYMIKLNNEEGQQVEKIIIK